MGKTRLDNVGVPSELATVVEWAESLLDGTTPTTAQRHHNCTSPRAATAPQHDNRASTTTQ
jgi:hypothetical protein